MAVRHTPIHVNEQPRFQGITTFMRLPHVTEPDDLDVALLGVPYDAGQYSTCSGARFGPRAVRNSSVRVRLYNQSLDMSPYEYVRVADCGDVIFNPLRVDWSHRAITEHVGRFVDAGVIPLCVGGDHTISHPLLRAIGRRHKPVGLVHFDAHSDTADEDLGMKELGHGTPFRRAIEEGLVDPRRTIQVGVRSIENAEEWDYPREQGVELITLDEMVAHGMEWVAGRFQRLLGGPIYVSIDIDVLDPAFAPASCPNPGGLTSRELMFLVRKLLGQQVVGGDIVELNAPYDLPTDPTSCLVAYLLFDLLCLTTHGRKRLPKD
jgi:guanidinopropionase